MPDPYVREVGRVVDMDGLDVVVGVDYDSVTIGAGRTRQWPVLRLSRDQVDDFGRAFIIACWEAGENKRRMDAEVVDAVIHAADCMNADCAGQCDAVTPP